MSVTIDGTKGLSSNGGYYASTTFTGTYTDGIVVDYTSTLGRISVGAADGLAFYNGGVASAEMARFDTSGNLLVGTTSVVQAGKVGIQFDGSVAQGIALKHTSSTANLLYFLNSSGSNVGSIYSSGTTTAYNTSSDYRLKEDIQPMTGALAKVVALKPVTYKWKADGSGGEGFIAHELAEVCPAAVTGEKDAVDEEGNPVYQGIDTSFLVATLTAAIQEQQALIEQLRADVAQLKAA